ncbi:MAG TPA: signal peptidase I [Candidatus Paceibacterota bacterium]
MRQLFASILEILETLVIVLVSIYFVYSFIAQPFLVQGASMEPNFESGDYLLVDEVTYRFREPERGEVIVFRNPANENEFYIKRVVGLPGETVIIQDGQVTIDGEPIKEGYLSDGQNLKGEYIFKLAEGEHFVMGDNRAQSFDSRSWGPLDEDLIIGIVRLRFWPPTTFAILNP